MIADPSPALAGRIALVTGGTRGIGAAIARGFAAAGARVYVHGLERDAGQDLAEEIGGAALDGDLSDTSQINGLARALNEREARLDILVNNAGVEVGATLAHLDIAALKRMLAVNFVAPVLLTQALLPMLRAAAHASVINVTSIHSTVPAYGNVAYAASKAALDMFTKTAAIELGPAGIRVNAIAPGAVETELNRHLLDEVGRDRFQRWIPLGRLGSPDDLVGPALFLASDASRYVSGETLVVDGAYSHHLVRYRSSGHA